MSIQRCLGRAVALASVVFIFVISPPEGFAGGRCCGGMGYASRVPSYRGIPFSSPNPFALGGGNGWGVGYTAQGEYARGSGYGWQNNIMYGSGNPRGATYVYGAAPAGRAPLKPASSATPKAIAPTKPRPPAPKPADVPPPTPENP